MYDANSTSGNKTAFGLKVTAIWVLLLLICYSFFKNSQDSEDYSYKDIRFRSDKTRNNSYFEEHSNGINHKDRILQLVDAVVFVAMGSMAADPMVDYSIASVRKLGKWNSEIFVITDSPECFSGKSSAEGDLMLKVITVPSAKNIIEIKALKPKILSLLPDNINGVLYLDVDILVTRNLNSFLRDLHEMTAAHILKQARLEKSSNVSSIVSSPEVRRPQIDFGAFLDAAGHYVGFCSGCEKWHTGVVWMQRQVGNECLHRWREILLSGKYNTDQQSLDEAEAVGACPRAMSFPSRHLLFAKDYIGMALTSGQTFVHVTAAGRPEDTDYFYREIVIPRLREALQPPLNAAALKHRKNCLATQS